MTGVDRAFPARELNELVANALNTLSKPEGKILVSFREAEPALWMLAFRMMVSVTCCRDSGNAKSGPDAPLPDIGWYSHMSLCGHTHCSSVSSWLRDRSGTDQ